MMHTTELLYKYIIHCKSKQQRFVKQNWPASQINNRIWESFSPVVHCERDNCRWQYKWKQHKTQITQCKQLFSYTTYYETKQWKLMIWKKVAQLMTLINQTCVHRCCLLHMRYLLWQMLLLVVDMWMNWTVVRLDYCALLHSNSFRTVQITNLPSEKNTQTT